MQGHFSDRGSLICWLEGKLLSLLPSTWRARLLGASAENRAILSGVGWVVVFLFLAKGIAAIKEIIIADRYGSSTLVDGYLFAFGVANWPIVLFFGVASSVLVPLFVRLESAHTIELARFKAELVGAGLLLGVVLGVGVFTLLPILIQSEWLGLTSEVRPVALYVVPFVAVIVPFGILSGLYSTCIMSRKNHSNTFLEGVPSLVIALMLVLWPLDGALPSLSPMLWGTTFGFMFQALWLAALTPRPVGVQIAFPRSSSYWKDMRNSLSYVMPAQLILSSSVLIDLFLLARLPEGSIATFTYANRVMELIVGLSVVALSRAMLPVFSSLSSANESQELAKRWAWRVFWLGMAVALILFLVAKPAVRLLFERGAFTSADTDVVSSILVILAMSLPFYLMRTVWMQWLLSRPRAARLLLVAALAGSAIKLGSGLIFVLAFDLGTQYVAFTHVLFSIGYLLVLMLSGVQNNK